MNIFDQLKNDDIAGYFRDLGYTVGWDFRAATGDSWYEIYTPDNKPVIQFDKGIKLKSLLRDLFCLKHGLEPDSPETYKFWRTEDNALWTELLKRVSVSVVAC